MQPAVHALVLVAQSQAGMWRRNGYSLQNQVVYFTVLVIVIIIMISVVLLMMTSSRGVHAAVFLGSVKIKVVFTASVSRHAIADFAHFALHASYDISMIINIINDY